MIRRDSLKFNLAFVSFNAYASFMPRKTSKPSPTRSARQQTDSASRPPQPSLNRELTPSLNRELKPSLNRELKPSLNRELKPSLNRELKPGDAIRRARSAGKSVGIAVSRAARPMLLPDELAALLADALDAHANGHRVELVVHAKAKSKAGGAHSHYLILDRDPNEELTTQQAAEALKVSRPTIIKAIEDGRLAARKIGKHRRVRVYDFNAFARAEHAALVAHARESDRMEQELGLYDIPLPKSITEWKRMAGRTKSGAKPSARRGKR